jgi:hypothetical protein
VSTHHDESHSSGEKGITPQWHVAVLMREDGTQSRRAQPRPDQTWVHELRRDAHVPARHIPFRRCLQLGRVIVYVEDARRRAFRTALTVSAAALAVASWDDIVRKECARFDVRADTVRLWWLRVLPVESTTTGVFRFEAIFSAIPIV